MGMIQNSPYELNRYSVINCQTSKATTFSGSSVSIGKVTASSTVSGSGLSAGASGTITGSAASVATVTASGAISGSSLKAGGLTTTGGNVTGVGTLTGSAITVSGPSGSINFSTFFGGSGSQAIATNLALLVTVTGSTYRIPLYT